MIRKILFFFLLTAPLFAQTTVTGTIIDPKGNPYANGTASAYSVPASGQPVVSVTPVATSSAGFFSFTVPAGTYVVTICAPPVNLGPTQNPTPKQICFSSQPIEISGVGQDVSANLNAIAVALGPTFTTGGITPGTTASAVLAPSTISFGTVQTGTNSLLQNVIISNAGTSASMTILSAVFSGSADFKSPNISACNGLLPAGGSCALSVFYNPSTSTAVTGSLLINSNTNPVSVALSGTGTAVATAPISVSSTDTGSGSIVSSEVPPKISCSFAPPALPSGACFNTYPVGTPVTLTATPGSSSTFQGFNGAAGCFLSPCTFTVAAPGATVIADFLENAPVNIPVISVTPATLAFGTVQTNTNSLSQNVVITNPSATVNLTVNSTPLTGNADFSTPNSNICNKVILPLGTCNIPITFRPTAAVAESATITINSNAATVPTVALTGTGTATTTKVLTISPGGTGAGTVQSGDGVVTPTPQSYSTSFLLTENPMSEGGLWIEGGTVGLGWTNISTTSAGIARGNQGVVQFTDSTAVLAGTWASDQQAQGTVFRNPNGLSCGQEVELRLRTTITANSITGYEISYSVAFGNLIIVRWNATVGNFTVLRTVNGLRVANGDVIRATIVGSTITAYKNGVAQTSVTDGTYTTGSPGIGTNYTQNSGCTTAEQANYGFSDFIATDSPTTGVPPTINCTVSNGTTAGACQSTYPNGTVVALTATPTTGNTFDGYSGGGCSTSPCNVTMNADTTVISTFNPAITTFNVGLSGVGGGTGTITSDVSTTGGPLSCLSTAGVLSSGGSGGCSGPFSQGQTIVLTATPSGSGVGTCGSSACTFVSWGGIPCLEGNNTSLTCTFQVTGNVIVSATFASSGASAPLALVQTINGGTPGTNKVTGTFASAQSAGNANLVYVYWNDNTTTVSGSVTDTSGNTYTQSACSPKTVSGLSAVLYYSPNIAAAGAGANTITVNLTAQPSYRVILAAEYSGLTATPVDVCAGATGTGTAIASGNLATNFAADLLTSGSTTQHSVGTIAPSFTQQISNSSAQSDFEDRQGVAIATYNAQPTQTSGPTIRNHGQTFCNSAVTTCASPTFTPVAGDSIYVVCSATSGATINSPTDSGSNSYTAITGPTTHGGTKDKTFKVDNATAFTNGAVSCNTSSASVQIVTYIDVAFTTGIDASATDKTYAATSSPWASNNLTTANADDLIVTCISNDAIAHTFTAPSNFVISDTDTFTACSTRNVSATQNTTYSWTGTGAADNMLVTATSFKAKENWATIAAAWKTTGTVAPQFSFALNLAGNGSGTITGGGLSCTSTGGTPSGTCNVSVASGSVLTITATPAAGGSAFVSYSGGGCGTAPTCVTSAITQNTSMTVTFNLPSGGGPFTILNQPAVSNRPYPTAFYNKKLPNAGNGGPPSGHWMPGSNSIVANVMKPTGSLITGAGLWHSPGTDDFASFPWYPGQASDPVYQVSGCTGAGSFINGQKFHAPSGAQYNANPGGVSDSNIIIWDQTTDVIFEFYTFGGAALPACSGTLSAPCAFNHSGNTYCSAQNHTTGSGIQAGTLKSNGLPGFSDEIRLTEIKDIRHINHALALYTACDGTGTANNYPSRTVFPIGNGSGSTALTCPAAGLSDTNRPPNGALVFLDYTQANLDCFDPNKPGTVCGGINKMTFLQFAFMEAMTLYGGVLQGTGGGDGIAFPSVESMQAYYFYDTRGFSGAKAVADAFATFMDNNCGVGGATITCTRTLRSAPHSLTQWNLFPWANISNVGGLDVAGHMHIADPCVAIAQQGLSSSGGVNACP